MRFLVDAQLPPALARWLAAAGHDAEHIADRGLTTAKDDAIWAHALATTRAIITKDEGFHARLALEGAGPTIIWVRLGNTRKRELLAWFEQRLPEILDALERGESIIELA
jgi:predicted nuclease of predicted toxin-antitoxin system